MFVNSVRKNQNYTALVRFGSERTQHNISVKFLIIAVTAVQWDYQRGGLVFPRTREQVNVVGSLDTFVLARLGKALDRCWNPQSVISRSAAVNFEN
ncbi:hypothetical protein N9006_02345 [bacterium]|nr:hypothetical protein [bacterium]MDB4372930.1 hypothetical protein [Mariniblastus sp.]MDA7904447.1 hypothetical protein [bacterium]MDB4386544.1 hypothetical protein [bacterium]MDB4392168.1 hypothetical protein [bacterium]